MICLFYSSTFLAMCIQRYTTRLKPNEPAHWTLYIVQIIFEICLTAAVLGAFLTILNFPKLPKKLKLVVASVWISALINSTLEDDYGDSTWAFKPSNMPLLIQNLHGHIFELVFIFIDLCLNSIPVRLGHVIHVWLYGLAYGKFLQISVAKIIF